MHFFYSLKKINIKTQAIIAYSVFQKETNQTIQQNL